MPYLLDTNIISELMNNTPDQQVINWLDQQLVDELFITSITVAEILFGIKRLEQGERRNQLPQQAALILDTHFQQKTYTFENDSAKFYADIQQSRIQKGLPISHADCQIAAISSAYAIQLYKLLIRWRTTCKLSISLEELRNQQKQERKIVGFDFKYAFKEKPKTNRSTVETKDKSTPDLFNGFTEKQIDLLVRSDLFLADYHHLYGSSDDYTTARFKLRKRLVEDPKSFGAIDLDRYK